MGNGRRSGEIQCLSECGELNQIVQSLRNVHHVNRPNFGLGVVELPPDGPDCASL